MNKRLSIKLFVLYTSLFAGIQLLVLSPLLSEAVKKPSAESVAVHEPIPSTAEQNEITPVMPETPPAQKPAVTQLPAEDLEFEVFADMTQFAGITAEELVALLGKPTLYNTGVIHSDHDFAIEYYIYSSVENLKNVYFVLTEGKVISAYTSACTIPWFGTNEEQLACMAIPLPEHLPRGFNSKQRFYYFPTDGIALVSFRNFQPHTQTFADFQVCYDLYYYDNWYLPLTEDEINHYIPLAKTIFTNTLAERGTVIQFTEDQLIFRKDPLYLLVTADIFDSSGELLYESGHCVFELATGELVGLALEDEVLYDPKGVMAEYGY